MNRLEEELRKALRRVDPPEGFAERLIAQAAATQRRRHAIFAWRGLQWALTGALCLALAAGGVEYRQVRVERARGEAAKAQLMLALRITANKLQLAQAKVQQRNAQQIDLSQTMEN